MITGAVFILDSESRHNPLESCVSNMKWIDFLLTFKAYLAEK
jgi:hypothetical protein